MLTVPLEKSLSPFKARYPLKEHCEILRVAAVKVSQICN